MQITEHFFSGGQKEDVLDFEIQKIIIIDSVSTGREKHIANDVFKTQMKKKARKHQFGKCVQISETLCTSLAAPFPTSSIFWSILSPSIYYQPTAKRAKGSPHYPHFCFFYLHLSTFFFPHCNLFYLSSIFPTSSVFYNITQFHLLLWYHNFRWLTTHVSIPSLWGEYIHNYKPENYSVISLIPVSTWKAAKNFRILKNVLPGFYYKIILR